MGRDVCDIQINLNICESDTNPAEDIPAELEGLLDGVRVTRFQLPLVALPVTFRSQRFATALSPLTSSDAPVGLSSSPATIEFIRAVQPVL